MKLELIAALGRAAEGQTVGWVTEHHADIVTDFKPALTTCSFTPGASTRSANGQEEITFPTGGRLIFLTPHRCRGFSLHRAYIPARASEDLLTAVLPSLDTTGGRAIAY